MFTLKYGATTVHIDGITTRDGRRVCSVTRATKSLRTGKTYRDLAVAKAEAEALPLALCRICRIGAEIKLNSQ